MAHLAWGHLYQDIKLIAVCYIEISSLNVKLELIHAIRLPRLSELNPVLTLNALLLTKQLITNQHPGHSCCFTRAFTTSV